MKTQNDPKKPAKRFSKRDITIISIEAIAKQRDLVIKKTGSFYIRVRNC